MSGIPKNSIRTKSKLSIPGKNGRVCCFLLDTCFVIMGTADDVYCWTVCVSSYTSTGSTDYPTLKEDIKVDVAIVGGGLVGVTAAYLLK